jgi:hypothetical protein
LKQNRKRSRNDKQDFQISNEMKFEFNLIAPAPN